MLLRSTGGKTKGFESNNGKNEKIKTNSVIIYKENGNVRRNVENF